MSIVHNVFRQAVTLNGYAGFHKILLKPTKMSVARPGILLSLKTSLKVCIGVEAIYPRTGRINSNLVNRSAYVKGRFRDPNPQRLPSTIVIYMSERRTIRGVR